MNEQSLSKLLEKRIEDIWNDRTLTSLAKKSRVAEVKVIAARMNIKLYKPS